MKNPIPVKTRTILFALFPLLLGVTSPFLTVAADLRVPSEHATIQAAIDAASSGDTIRIAPGDYREQLLIVDKMDLTLAGETGAVIHATMAMAETLQPYGYLWYPVLGLVRSDVVLSNLTFDGERLANRMST